MQARNGAVTAKKAANAQRFNAIALRATLPAIAGGSTERVNRQAQLPQNRRTSSSSSVITCSACGPLASPS